MTGAVVCSSGMMLAGLVDVLGTGVGGASVLCAGPTAVALLRVGWLNVRSPVLLDLHLRFCILDVALMYFSC